MLYFTQPEYYCAKCYERLMGDLKLEDKVIIYKHYKESECEQKEDKILVFISSIVKNS